MLLQSPKYYHLSPIKNITELKPLSDKYSNDRKNTQKPKISLGSTIYGCVHGLVLPNWRTQFDIVDDNMKHVENARIDKQDFLFYLYSVDSVDFDKRSIVECPEFDLTQSRVFDILITGELGYTKPIKCNCLGPIVVHMQSKTSALLQFPFSLPATIKCTLPNETQWILDLLNFNIRPSVVKDKQLESILNTDRKLFIQQLQKAFVQYIKFIDINANRVKENYKRAIKFLETS
jgi:hypothetical protein